jgi:hypothetical protein
MSAVDRGRRPTARGEWSDVVERYVAEKSDAGVSEVVLG